MTTLPVRYPALDLWRREVRAGVGGQRADSPGTWRTDWLWRAATWEQAAAEALARGDRDHARQCWLRARREHAAHTAAA